MHLLRYGAMVTTGLLLSVNQAQATIQTDLSAGLPSPASFKMQLVVRHH